MRSPSPAPALGRLLERFAGQPALRTFRERLTALEEVGGGCDVDRWVALFEDALPVVEEAVWSAGGPDAEVLSDYRAAFREWEALIARRGEDRRHRFFVIIPVADRPHHLRNILDSLLDQCREFGYGGFSGTFRKVVAIIADDSADTATIRCNRQLAREYERAGLRCIYFGAEAQQQMLDALSSDERTRLAAVLGHPETTGIHHKGASITRNLAALFVSGFDESDALFLFVDSDEQFKIRLAEPDGDRDLGALSYFHALDRLFRRREVQVATGKVVGDPPVSPAVMTANFLADVIAFLEQMAAADPGGPCRFHRTTEPGGDGAYHDMAALFGLPASREPYRYRCSLRGTHDHAACLHDFAARLDRFFDGEHLTRPTCYRYSDPVATAQPARTVYTGNYVLTAKALKYFIPFADQKLRMAGPTLGRLIQAELGEGFVAVNLPLLHGRTLEGGEAFRPGVMRRERRVDLSGEFERQFFGDVMLFTVAELTKAGFPGVPFTDGQIQQTLETVEADLQRRYADKRRTIQERLERLRTLFEAPENWWYAAPGLEKARERFRHFFANVAENFGPDSRCHALTGPGEHRTRRLAAIRAGIAGYRSDRLAWEALLRRGVPAPLGTCEVTP